jgi:erythromycin esterase-like protein
MKMFWQRAGVVPVSLKVRSLLAEKRGVTDDGSGKLRMIEEGGRYADRPVTYFRVFDPETAARAKVVPHCYADLGADLVAYAGHVERDGTIVLNAPRA